MAQFTMRTLDDLLSTVDLKSEIHRTFDVWLANHALPEVFQFGLVAHDLNKVVSALEVRGITRFLFGEGSPSIWREQGSHRDTRMRLALSHYQSYQLEIIQPLYGTDIYASVPGSHEAVTLHHLGVLIADLDEVTHRLSQEGIKQIISGSFKFGPLRADFAYYDTLDHIGVMLEASRWQLFGITFRPSLKLIAFIAHLQHVTGMRAGCR